MPILIIYILFLSSYFYSNSSKINVLIEPVRNDNKDIYRTVFVLNDNRINFTDLCFNPEYIIKSKGENLYVYNKDSFWYSIPMQPFNETREFIVNSILGEDDLNSLYKASKIIANWKNNSHRAFVFYKLADYYHKSYKNTKNGHYKEIALRFLSYTSKFDPSRTNDYLYRKIKNKIKLLR